MIGLGGAVSALAYAGIGAGLGTVGAAVISSRSGKGESRAHAADLLTNAAGELMDRLSASNKEADETNRNLRTTLQSVTDVLDMLLPYMTGVVPPDVITEARRVLMTGKLAI